MNRSPSSSSRSPSSSSCSNVDSLSRNVNRRKTYTMSTIGQKPILVHGMADSKCYCGKNAPVWVSWTDVNPGRRFITCAFFNRCNFHKWVDDEMQDRAKEVIIGLRNREKELVAGMNTLADESEELRQKEARLDAIVTILKKDATFLKEENERLKLVVRRRDWFLVFCLIVCTFIFWLN